MIDRMQYPGQYYPFGPFPPGYGPGPWGAPFPMEAPPSPASSVRSLNRVGRTRRRKKLTSEDDDEELSMSSSPMSRPKSSSSERPLPAQKSTSKATRSTSSEEEDSDMGNKRDSSRNRKDRRRGKCGAPRAIDDRGERRLRRCVRADRRATVEQLIAKMNQGATKSVSQTTIQRTLLRLGLRSRRLVRAHMLTAVHRRRKLEFARQYSSWTSTEWRHVAFSDESRFMLHRTDGRWRIRRETSERNHPATIAGTVQATGGSIMVWGMLSWHYLGSLIIVEGTIDQYKYASVLADYVHPYMRIVFLQDDVIFQQDNARCHTAASVRAWFEEHQDEFTVLPLPANSLDLNPIEHLWYHLDQVVRAMDPQPRNLAQLATALESAWLNIPENTFRA
ncbi:transposable element Tcb1 transposase [Trichonephila clavipes]|nr:transposable element Tcb1 transposase [Trichonephila clavipes]